jgi:hypothetical protein
LYQLYYNALKQIHDGHLSIITYGDQVDFGKKYKAYFKDVLIEKINNRFEPDEAEEVLTILGLK